MRYNVMTKQQKRITKVLEKMIILCEEDEFNADVFSNNLDIVLEDLLGDDFFGTEGQCDPRGDGRNGIWNMFKVEGID